MNEHSLKKLKLKFIIAAMVSLLITMVFIAGFLYLGNSIINQQIVKNTLTYIIKNNGDLIQWTDKSDKSSKPNDHYIRFLEEIFSDYQSPEFPASTRYFAILYDDNDNVMEIKASHITAVSEEEAQKYGQMAISRNSHFGRFDNYYYQVEEKEDGSSIVVYLDSTSILHMNQRLLILALTLIVFGMIIAFFLVRIFSSKVIKNEIKNAELQKQFMTNASHELKTPLAVIRANTEMQEMLDGESEWTQSTMRQIERMSGLIQNLVMITRADENNSHLDAQDIDITKSVSETVKTFQPLAIQNNKTLTAIVADGVHMRAEDAQIRQLCSLLVDNAIKYCDDGGEIDVSLSQKGKGITLIVSNSYAAGENVDYTKFFERFYREDHSHNIDKGGYGIGLSIAESLVKQYRGTINVTWKKAKISFTCQLKPAL